VIESAQTPALPVALPGKVGISLAVRSYTRLSIPIRNAVGQTAPPTQDEPEGGLLSGAAGLARWLHWKAFATPRMVFLLFLDWRSECGLRQTPAPQGRGIPQPGREPIRAARTYEAAAGVEGALMKTAEWDARKRSSGHSRPIFTYERSSLDWF